MVSLAVRVLLLVTFMVLCVVGNGDESSSGVGMYWKKVLPNTPMPQSIKDSLYRPDWLEDDLTTTLPSVVAGDERLESGTMNHRPVHVVKPQSPPAASNQNYLRAASPAQLHDPSKALFFLQEDLRLGSKRTLRFTWPRKEGSKKSAPFLSRSEAASIPFSSKEFPGILDRFSVSPGSEDAKAMYEAIDECEKKWAGGVAKYCATSLESLLDFATDKLGSYRVKAVGTEVKGDAPAGLQDYTVVAVKQLKGARPEVIVACHKETYQYSVYFCHENIKTVGYMVSLVGDNGVRVEAGAACHKNTSTWNPKHLAFQALKVKPGAVPICHFFAPDNLFWI